MKNLLLYVKTFSKLFASFAKMLNWYKPGLFILLFSYFLFVNSAMAQPPSHDPSSMIRNTDGRYWIFTTGKGIWCMSSSNANFTNWRAEKAPFANGYPSWISNYVDGFNGSFWAPDVIKIGSTYYLYYSCAGKGAPAVIGLATASDLKGPWTDRGMIVAGNNAIDPAVYKDGGRLWMAWGNWQSGIDICELNSSNGLRKNSSKTHLVSGQVEGPGLIKNGNYYYLFYQRGLCCKGVNSTYYMVVARSKRITGPYSGERTFLPNRNGNIIGPGHFGYGAGKLTYHYYDGNNNGKAKLKVTTLGWSNGWPVAASHPSTSYFSIYNRHSGKVFDVSGSSTANGAAIIQYSNKNQANQQFESVSVGNDYYIFKARHSGKALRARGNYLEQYTFYNHYWTEMFKKINVGDGYFLLKNRHTNKCLRIEHSSYENGAKIVLDDCKSNYWSQQFRFNSATTLKSAEGALAIENVEMVNDLILYPNPFSESTTIHFNLSVEQEVSMNLYDMTGRLVDAVQTETYSVGQHEVVYNNAFLNAGMYILKVQTGSSVKSIQLLVE